MSEERLKPGYYWAKLKTPSGGTIYGIDGHPSGVRIEPEMNDDGSCAWASTRWEIVEVWDNNAPDDPEEYVGVSVPGLPVTQWPQDFFWGPRVDAASPDAPPPPSLHREPIEADREADYTAAEIEFMQCLLDRYSEGGGAIPLVDDHRSFMAIVRKHYPAHRLAFSTPAASDAEGNTP